jgi:acyl-CoA synthetase (AMP-forming)/AMP-acid ligase II
MTYGELTDKAASLGASLRASGVRRGDRVAVIAGNRPEYLVAALAIWAVGAIVATVYRSFQRDELAYVAANARPRLAMVERDRARDMRNAMAGHGEVWTIEPGGIRIPEPRGPASDCPAAQPMDPAVSLLHVGNDRASETSPPVSCRAHPRLAVVRRAVAR